jgi:uncharacterized membrane protein YqjE
MTGLGYSASAIGVLTVGLVALLLVPQYPTTAAILIGAVIVTLASLGLSWLKLERRKRRSAVSFQLRI